MYLIVIESIDQAFTGRRHQGSKDGKVEKKFSDQEFWTKNFWTKNFRLMSGPDRTGTNENKFYEGPTRSVDTWSTYSVRIPHCPGFPNSLLPSGESYFESQKFAHCDVNSENEGFQYRGGQDVDVLRSSALDCTF